MLVQQVYVADNNTTRRSLSKVPDVALEEEKEEDEKEEEEEKKKKKLSFAQALLYKYNLAKQVLKRDTYLRSFSIFVKL